MSHKAWLTLIVIVVIAAGIGYGFLTSDKANQSVKTTNINKNARTASVEEDNSRFPMAPDFVLEDLDGNLVQLSKHRDKVVILDFWATWCGPCRMEVPHFIELQDEYEDDLVILGVSVDQGDLSVVPEFAENMDINYTILYFTPQVVRAYGGIPGIPTTFTIDKNGRVRDRAVGYRPKSYFKNLIEKMK